MEELVVAPAAETAASRDRDEGRADVVVPLVEVAIAGA